MGFLKDVQIGFSSYGKAVSFIFRHRMAWFFLLPILLNLLLLIFGYEMISSLSSYFINVLQSSIESSNWDFFGADFLTGTLSILIWIVLRIFLFLLFAFIGGYIVLILMSPILAFISEKTEKIIQKHDYPFSFLQLLKDVWRGILIALRNFMLEIAAILLLFLLSFIPVIGTLSFPILFLVSAYYYGFSFIDYTSERRKLKIKASVAFVRQNRGLAITNGALFAASLLIPFIGLSLAGFFAIISTVAATISVIEKEQLLK